MGLFVNSMNTNFFVSQSLTSNLGTTSNHTQNLQTQSNPQAAGVQNPIEVQDIKKTGNVSKTATTCAAALDKLAAIGKIDLFMNRKRRKPKKQNTPKIIPTEGKIPNPFSSDEEIEAYNDENFAHGQVVDPFEYRTNWRWKKFIWLENFSDYLNEKMEVYDPTKKTDEKPVIRATHLKQGYISNCWMVATLALLAHKQPDYIMNMIEIDKLNNQYIVKLVDGRLKMSLKPENIRSQVIAKTGAAWAGIIEAAVAKAIGMSYFEQSELVEINTIEEKRLLKKGYEIMNHGNYCTYAIYYLTGKKARFFMLEEESRHKKFSYNWQDKLIVLGNHYYESREEDAPSFDWDADGIVSGHAYSLLEHSENNDLFLFNPWGEYEPGTNTHSKIHRFNSDDLCNDGMFSINEVDFWDKRCWSVYEITDEPAKSLNSVLHVPLPEYFNSKLYDQTPAFSF